MTADRPPADAPYRDSSLSAEQRTADLISRMTLPEKLDQLVCAWLGKEPPTDVSSVPVLGAVVRLAADAHLPAPDMTRLLNAVQRRMVNDSRLQIPVVFVEEALCGLQTREATLFPDAIAQAATWDPQLVEEMSTVSRRQMLTIGIRQALSPLCDIAPDPRWGRIEETYGEDPYLAGVLATAFVRGLQGPDPAEGTMATLKHFLAYGISYGGRNLQPTHLGPRQLREMYGLPFEMVIRDAGARGVMVSYGAIDGVAVQASRELLTDLLRSEYGFEGTLMSDLGGIQQLATRHGVAADMAEAGALALEAGTDIELGNEAFRDHLSDAIAAGKTSDAEVDRALRRVLEWKFRLGLFERPYVDEDKVPAVLDSAEDRDLARRAAVRSIVLLRNEPVDGTPLLPLDTGLERIAVIGPNADRAYAHLGNYSHPVICSCVKQLGEAAPGPGGRARLSADRTADVIPRVDVVTVLQGVKASTGAEVRYAKGSPIEDEDRSGFDEAREAASWAQVAVVVVGDQAGLISGATVGEGVDSATCRLPGVQRELVEIIAATGTPTVVVLCNGRPFVVDWLSQTVPAIMGAWFGGEEGGTAIADVLFGATNPAGRTPVTFLPEVGLAPAPYNRGPGGNPYYDAEFAPVHAFGHGLSYTTFSYEDLRVEPASITTDGRVSISCAVRNTGDRDGDEVVQLYLRDPVARTSRPVKELKGFVRTAIAAGDAVRVTFDVSAERVALFDPSEGWVVEPGEVEVMVGASSSDIRLTGSFAVTGDPRTVGRDRALTTAVTVEHVVE